MLWSYREYPEIKVWRRISLAMTKDLGPNIWIKVKKSSEIGQDKKSLISAFASFLTAIA